MELKLLKLADLVKWEWEGNPKAHRLDLVQRSLAMYGYRDLIEVDAQHKLVVAGHGRIEALVAAQKEGKQAPLNVVVKGKGKSAVWWVNCLDHAFATREEALGYALLNNRAGVAKLRAEDYKAGKLRAAMVASGQTHLPGFSEMEVEAVDSKRGRLPPAPLGLPGLLPSTGDPPDLPTFGGDGTGVDGYLLMLSFETREDWLETIEWLLDETPAPDSSYHSEHAKPFLSQWRKDRKK